MLKILNTIGIVSLLFAVYSGYNLYNITPEEPTTREIRMEVKEERKIKPPKELPKSFDQKVLSKRAMIESSDLVVEKHIIKVLNINKYSCLGKSKDAYAAEFSSAVLRYTNGDIKLALWLTAMSQVESSYRLTADPKVSNARGFLQVIPKWHIKDLSKAGITAKDLSTNPAKSIRAGIIVFQKYLKQEKGNYRRATRRYRGLKVPEDQQVIYFNAIQRIYNELLNELRMYA